MLLLLDQGLLRLERAVRLLKATYLSTDSLLLVAIFGFEGQRASFALYSTDKLLNTVSNNFKAIFKATTVYLQGMRYELTCVGCGQPLDVDEACVSVAVGMSETLAAFSP